MQYIVCTCSCTCIYTIYMYSVQHCTFISSTIDYLSPEEMASLESKVTDLRKSEARLKLEATHLKEVSDVARQQVVAMETWKKSHDLVMSSLHHQLLDAQSASDDKTVVGKLQLQIASLQVSESEALRALETANVKVSTCIYIQCTLYIRIISCTHTHVHVYIKFVHLIFQK